MSWRLRRIPMLALPAPNDMKNGQTGDRPGPTGNIGKTVRTLAASNPHPRINQNREARARGQSGMSRSPLASWRIGGVHVAFSWLLPAGGPG